MRNARLGSVAALLLGAGGAFAQPAPLPSGVAIPPSIGGVPAPLPAIASPSTSTSIALAPATTPAAAASQPAVIDNPGCANEVMTEASCTSCASTGRFGASAEYLLWSVKNGPLPSPLVTTGPLASAGVIGNPGTQVLIGNSDLDYGMQSGARLGTIYWFDDQAIVGVEAGGFFLGKETADLRAASNATGSPLLSRPIINARTNAESAIVLAAPGLLVGDAAVSSATQMWGAEANFVGNLLRGKGISADMLVGLCYFGLDESLTINSSTRPLPAGVAAFNGVAVRAPNSIAVVDQFKTRNDFYGGQVGARTELRFCEFYVDVQGKVGIGNTYESVVINGASTLLGPAGVLGQNPAGVLAVPSNGGLMTRNQFSVVPQLALKLGYALTHHLSLYVDYSFLYWTNVARPGNQIDRTVNPGQVPSTFLFGTAGGPIQPSVPFLRSDVWAQGVGFGMEFRF